MNTSYHAAGIDISKKNLDLAFAGQSPRANRRLTNNDSGCKSLVKILIRHQIDLVAVEATGGYERRVVQHLQDSGIPVAVVQPSLIRHYALSKKILAKTDAIDAVVIADYAQQNAPKPTPQQDQQTVKLRALSDRRDHLTADCTREKNRLETCACQAVAKQIRQSIQRLEKLISTLETQIQKLIASNNALSQTQHLLMQIKGVGPVCTAVLLAYLPELGHANRQEIAALAGLAPYSKDSGNKRAKRKIYGGRNRLRQALYMSAVSASQHNPVIRQTYERLVSNGKSNKVALCACARKLLIYLNGVVGQSQVCAG